MRNLKIDGLGRAKARKLIMELPRNKAFITDILSDGTKIFFTTDGEKQSRENGELIKGNYDIKIHFESELKGNSVI